MSYRCKHCTKSIRCIVQDTPMLYCVAHKQYCPTPAFVEAWGCDEFEDTQLTLFNEERRKKK